VGEQGSSNPARYTSCKVFGDLSKVRKDGKLENQERRKEERRMGMSSRLLRSEGAQLYTTKMVEPVKDK
jgi:hypothetical protein